MLRHLGSVLIEKATDAGCGRLCGLQSTQGGLGDPSASHMQWAWLPVLLLAAAPFRVRMWKNAGDGAACQTGMNPEQWPVAKSNPRS